MRETAEVVNPAISSRVGRIEATAAATIGKHVVLLLEVVIAALVLYVFQIEGPAFVRLFAVATAGFAVSMVLPLQHRLPFFVALSLVGSVVVFGVADAAWLIGAGLTLILVTHLPVPFKARVAILIATALLLAAARAGFVSMPWSAGVWPILGSMFMFRLVIYMHGRKGKPAGGEGPWAPLAYFFMLPNLSFPLFPVVDYQTFRRTYFDKPDIVIYEQGVLWIVRGIVHLLLYRFVYQAVLLDPVDVSGLGDLVQYMLGTFLLYLRVSGQFHLIVGILHLFGFRLPETHKLYYLAHSFTELWRRINIYWTDFMMKVVFYPTYFSAAVKKLGPRKALVVSTTAVFLTTWILHSYQWFWLRGGFPLTLQDTLFWAILGALVVAGALRELDAPKRARQAAPAWDWRLGVKAAVTFAFFCFLWSLWSTESVSQWLWMMTLAANVDLKGVVLLTLALGTIGVLGSRNWDTAARTRPAWLTTALQPTVRAGATLVVLLALGQPGVMAAAPQWAAQGLKSLHATGLNERDAALQHRGYYEQLDVRAQLNTQVLDVVGNKTAGWQDLSMTGVLNERHDMMLRDLKPSMHVLWNGHPFSTNRWGMRDGDYETAKPAGTLRIALLGPSHVMGNGVSDGETFEAVVEQRLNAAGPIGRYQRVEILNFGVDGYSLTQQVAILKDRVLAFDPDIVIATHYQRNLSMTERYLQKLVWGDIEVTPELEALLVTAGLDHVDRGRVPVPSVGARTVAKWVGINPRMPTAEAATRTRSIADDVLEWSIRDFAQTTRARAIVPVMLALNAVIDDRPAQVPNLKAIQDNKLPLIDLFDVFPDARRASLRVAPWDDHPNAEGHRLVADRLYSELHSMLTSGALAGLR